MKNEQISSTLSKKLLIKKIKECSLQQTLVAVEAEEGE